MLQFRRLVPLIALAVAACAPTPASSPTAAPSSSQAAPAASSSAPSADAAQERSANSGGDIIDNPPAKTWQDAYAKATKAHDGKPSKIELEHDSQGRLHYKIELISATHKFSLQCDATDLTELDRDQDDLGDDAAKDQKKTFDPQKYLTGDTFNAAVAAARDAQPGSINKWKLEGKDDGQVIFEFDITPDGATDDVEVQVDASSGQVINTD